ncbi:MAG: methyltransferase domain-containing protein [Bacteroidia bacterium]|nr:methyltransferase domain-containing protein [Bacteroidia bacterium]NNK27236.1 methyltransferase domain-containing protein [Flavobacteriaceae bacterium]
MKDIFGKALLDFQSGDYSEDIVTATSISSEDTLPLPYLFRGFNDMPEIEQKALELCRGRVLDVGCGAGSHSLYIQDIGLEVKAIDVSEGAIMVSKLRGVKSTAKLDLLNETETFDTILLLMNGTGIFQSLDLAPTYLKHLRSLLNLGGQIFIDSSDIIYMYKDDDGGIWQDTNANYYGELDYHLSYKGEKKAMKWLYLDFNKLQSIAEASGLDCELMLEGEHHDYLARLTAAE